LVAKELLEILGFTVIEASNGKEALELYQKHVTDITLVVTDMGMPIMNGYELFRELKKLNPNLPIVISSGFGNVAVSSHIAPEDIAGIISKPYSFDLLQKVLKKVVEERTH
jgi:CheY-like chemotaxis protein